MHHIRFAGRAAFFAALLVAACALMGAAVQPSSKPASRPAPDLSPAEVVTAQLAALRRDDQQAGIEQAYHFASPAIQKMIGSPGDFAAMLHQQYADMLTQTHARAKLRNRSSDRAEVVAYLRQATGQASAYVYQLLRQHGGGCDGCWKINGVIALKPAHNQPVYSI